MHRCLPPLVSPSRLLTSTRRVLLYSLSVSLPQRSLPYSPRAGHREVYNERARHVLEREERSYAGEMSARQIGRRRGSERFNGAAVRAGQIEERDGRWWVSTRRW